MKNNMNIMRTTITALAIALMPLSMAAQKVKQLTILHTNDTHSCILPVKRILPIPHWLAEVVSHVVWLY